MHKLPWAILGTGHIAQSFAESLKSSHTGELLAVASRHQHSADAFADKYGAPKRYTDTEALFHDPEVQAVYIATPHPAHPTLAIRALAAGKHVLVEKPMALNQYDAMAIIEAARAHDRFLMEAYMYRCHPQTKKLVELIRTGAIGQLRFIQATFSFHWPNPPDPNHRLLSPELAGGGILDVGGYPVSMARLLAGAAANKPFLDPVKVDGAAHLGPTGVDEWAAAILTFDTGVIATCAAGVQVAQENALRVYGSAGWIHVPTPWVPARAGGPWRIILHRDNKEQEILSEERQPLYALEADTVAAHLDDRQAPEMSWPDSLGNLRALDAWRKAAGLTYPQETPHAYRKTTVAGAPLAVQPNPMLYYAPTPGASEPMRGRTRFSGSEQNPSPHNQPPAPPFAAIPGIHKKISRLVMGVDNQTSLPHGAIIFDDFFQRGGTAFDTAYVYAGGACERTLGQWHKLRNLREQIVILAKGAHTPFCDPKSLVKQLDESLNRLQTDYVDLYLLHRDNPDVPVGEFVDALNQQLRLGRLHAFGGSNWSIQRLQQANAYAQKHNLTPFAALSNNFSLARMVNPPWAGCLSASDPESRAFLTQTQLPLLPWSSQARGFFLEGKAAPDKQNDPELTRCWYAPDNFQRLQRVHELAKKKNVRPINIALAYVLHQPFPTFPLIGPRTLEETRTSLDALTVPLTPHEVRWLNLESPTPTP